MASHCTDSILLNLPLEIIDTIFRHINCVSILTLRQVCKLTKAIVDESAGISKRKPHIILEIEKIGNFYNVSFEFDRKYSRIFLLKAMHLFYIRNHRNKNQQIIVPIELLKTSVEVLNTLLS
ncbi:hypothetical protein PFISCL1PPCAC_1056, partial [Pristionchus fissidentatus]